MSIQAGDFRLSFERVTASESIHRVEREAPTRDFGKKNREQKRDQDTHGPEFETPQDVVEVAGHDSKDLVSNPVPKNTSDAAHAISHPVEIAAQNLDKADRRIDIKV